jgi:hypothetical protein
MSELIPFKRGQVAKAFEGIDHGPALGEAVPPSGFSSIRYRGKQWTLQHAGHSYPFLRPDDNTPLTYLDLIIVGQQPKISKVYFPGDFDEDSTTGPVCASIRGDVPDPGVSIPQSKTCGLCKHNLWTTLPRGGRGKECQDHFRLAVLLLPSHTKKMLGSPLKEPVFFKVPPGSLQAFATYGAELKDEGYPPFGVVTRVSFHPDKLFQIVFSGVKLLSEQEAEIVKPMLDSQITRRIIGETTLIPITESVKPKVERIDTGLIEAFTDDGGFNATEALKAGATVISEGGGGGGGSGRLSKPKPKSTPTKEVAAKVEEAVQESTEETFDYEAADADTDKKVDDVLKKSVNDMFN